MDTGLAGFIAFIDNDDAGLHPDFGGERLAGQRRHLRLAVRGRRRDASRSRRARSTTPDESDGVNHATEHGVPFYPIPAEAITQPHWIEGGEPGNVDLRASGDRHLLIVDRDNRTCTSSTTSSTTGRSAGTPAPARSST